MDKPNFNQMDDSGAKEGREGGREGRGGGRGFGRRKVDPFLLDKTLVLDYKNIKALGRFVSETGKIVPRHITGATAKHQRQIARFVKRCRNLGLFAPKMEG